MSPAFPNSDPASPRFVVATVIDRRFVELAGVMLHTLIENGDVDEAAILVLCDGLSAKDKSRLRQCLGSRPAQLLDLDDASLQSIKGLKTNSNWSRAIYGRLILPQFVSPEVEQILYLDADTIVVDSLRPLLATDMAGFPVAAVGGVSEGDCRRLDLPLTVKTLNSGVLLINVKEWLARDLTRACLEIANDANRPLKFFDQDALNIALAGDFVALDIRWNVATGASSDKPAIFHFTHDKPNSIRCKHPAQNQYLAYRQATPWANKRLKPRWHKRVARLTNSFRTLLRLR